MARLPTYFKLTYRIIGNGVPTYQRSSLSTACTLLTHSCAGLTIVVLVLTLRILKGREIVASIAETAAKAGRAATIVLCARSAAEGEKVAAEIQAYAGGYNAIQYHARRSTLPTK